MSELRRTPLYDIHLEEGGKIVPFAGWELPVLYSSVIQEHHAVRNSCGIFDVSHMGEILVEGKDALPFLQYVTCNDLSKIPDGKAQYGALLTPQGGVIDDIIAYRYSDQKFLLCVNASNDEKDFTWLQEQTRGDVRIVHQSHVFGQIAVQGPQSFEVISSVFSFDPRSIPYFGWKEVLWQGVSLLIARTGYTGENGVEIFSPWQETSQVWKALRQDSRVTPCGLGARDSLRLEACYPLHGHELDEHSSALESGLSWIIKFEKGNFIGKEALEAEKASGIQRKLCGFELVDPGISRQGDKVFLDEVQVGEVTSGTKTPTVNKSLGLLRVPSSVQIGDEVLLQVRDKKLRATIVKIPFINNVTR